MNYIVINILFSHALTNHSAILRQNVNSKNLNALEGKKALERSEISESKNFILNETVFSSAWSSYKE